MNVFANALTCSVICIFCTSLAACATAGPKPPRVVNMPVASTCIPKSLPPAPVGLETKESLASAPDAASLLQRLYVDWSLRVARMAETEPVIEACR